MARAKSSLGGQLNRLMKKNKIAPEALAEAAGIEVQELLDYGADERMPPVAVILRLARALSVEPDSLIAAGEKKRADKEDDHDRRKTNYNYTMLTPSSKRLHLRAFIVTIPARSTHEKVVYTHPGEEFIYVLNGKLDLKVGRKTYRLESGQSQHFDSTKQHILSNPGARANRLLVIVYTP